MRTLVLMLIFLVALFGSWCLVYNAYDKTQTDVLEKQLSGDFTAARETLEKYTAGPASFLLRKIKYFNYFAENLAYAEGVVSARLGDTKTAEEKFRFVSRAIQADVAARALYNGAEYLVEKGELDAAREKYGEALKLKPYDVQTKINLELLLKKIEQRNKGAKELKGLLGLDQLMSDYWLRKIPEQDSPSAGSSKKVWR